MIRCTTTYLVQYIVPAVFSGHFASTVSNLVDVRFLDCQLLIITHDKQRSSVCGKMSEGGREREEGRERMNI